MSVRRALVGCTVLSVQDACVFYPYCKGCFSRIDVKQRDTTRCSRCGYSCLKEAVDYRYRLSLRVTRDRRIFGVTVFGSCLTPFFGIHASGLQMLVDNEGGPEKSSSRARELLAVAVEDCFIGRHFVFGIKVTGTESAFWSGGPGLCTDRVQFIASQMILPKAAGSEGCTVVRFYQILLQKAVEYEHRADDPSKTSRPPETPLLQIHCRSSASSFNSSTLSDACRLSQSPQRSQHQDSTLTPTPPWEQSLGLITSSAEQDEGTSTQRNVDSNSRQTDNNKTIHRIRKSFLVNHKVRIAQSNSPLADPSFSPSPPGHERGLSPHCEEKGSSTPQLAETFLSNSLAWDDLPFSESLTEFLDKDYKDFDPVIETESHPNSRHEILRSNLEISNQHRTENHPWMLQDITNTPHNRGERHDSWGQACQANVGCVKTTGEYQQKEKAAVSLSYENSEQQHEGDTYDCSVDLFSSSLVTDMDRETETNPHFSNTGKRHTSSEKLNVPPSTPHKYTLKANRPSKRDSFPLPGTNDFDFIPPAQSTPDAQAHLPQCGGECTQVWSLTPIRHDHGLTPKRSFWRPNKQRKPPLAERLHPRGRRGSPGRTNHKRDSGVGDVAACDPEVSEVVVPPAPVAKTRRSHHHPPALTSSQREPAQSGNGDMAMVDAGSVDGSDTSPLGDENQTCDWSRDLFSDSV